MTVDDAAEGKDTALVTTGEKDGWRWAMIGDAVALDNRPMVDAAGPLDAKPVYQSVIAPLPVLEAATVRRRFVTA